MKRYRCGLLNKSTSHKPLQEVWIRNRRREKEGIQDKWRIRRRDPHGSISLIIEFKNKRDAKM